MTSRSSVSHRALVAHGASTALVPWRDCGSATAPLRRPVWPRCDRPRHEILRPDRAGLEGAFDQLRALLVLGDVADLELRVWVTLADANRVVELDSATGRRTGEAVRVPGQPRGIAFDGERLWVSATTGGYLAVFDPDSPGEPTRVDGIRGPREVRFGLGAIWVTTGSNERVIAIDPETRERIRGFDVGPLTYGLAVSDRFAWAASEDTGRLVKIARE